MEHRKEGLPMRFAKANEAWMSVGGEDALQGAGAGEIANSGDRRLMGACGLGEEAV